MDNLSPDIQFMRMALRQAEIAAEEGEVPCGAVIVKDGEVIGKAHNQTETLNDPTAHAEVLAITQATQAVGNWRLNGAVMYVTKEPCPMCAGALVLARIEKVVWGMTDPIRGGAISKFQILDTADLNHSVEVETGLMEAGCKAIMQTFFQDLRQKSKERKKESRRDDLENERISANELWNTNKEEEWSKALEKYWDSVKPTHLEIEKEFDSIAPKTIQAMNPQQWYDFLREKYFFWKYTAPNRYKTTTIQLEKYLGADNTLDNLQEIKEEIFSFDVNDTAKGLKIACKIRGLGVAGASGLLAVLFPSHFATVDQFAVKSLKNISDLPEMIDISRMNPEQLKVKDGILLIKIMREKAEQLNKKFQTSFWTPRKIDMVLWVLDR